MIIYHVSLQTTTGYLLFYDLNLKDEQKGLYIQTDSPHANLRRDSAELFIKETIPALTLCLVNNLNGSVGNNHLIIMHVLE